MRGGFWTLLAAIALAVIVLAAFMSRNKDVPVRAGKAVVDTIASTITTNGKIEPLNNFEAHAPLPTTIKRVFVHEGQKVRAGQPLLQLDDASARAQAARAVTFLRAAQADMNTVRSGGTHDEVLTNQSELSRARTDLETAQRNLDALKGLQQRGAASQGEVLDAENRLKTAQAQVNLLQQKLSSRFTEPDVARVQAQGREARATLAAAQEVLRQSNITAPHAGTVYFLPVKQGQFVNTGDMLVQVADLSKLRVRAFVDEPDIGRLGQGEKVEITWDALPGRSWEGTVSQIPTTVVTVNTRNVGEVLSVVANPDGKLLPNTNVNVSLIIAKHDQVLTVPREAVREDDGQHFVYEISNGALKKEVVQTGISNLTRTEITQGLQPNAQVALGATNSQPLRPGQAVRVVSE